MKNKEKYFNKILEAFINGEGCVFKISNIYKRDSCTGISCDECAEITKQWLEQEYKEHVKLTRNEKAILESLDNKWSWIARDECNSLGVYSVAPVKGVDVRYWVLRTEGDFESLNAFKHLFQFIKWEDEEPYSIEELLKCEVVEDD